jgi:hypothetical protein
MINLRGYIYNGTNNRNQSGESMKLKIIFILIVGLFLYKSTYSQVQTEETKKTVDEKTGDTTLTRSIIIAQSEDITPRNHMIVINPLKFILFYNLTYFQKVSQNIGIGGGLQIPTISGLNGFGINAEMRLYPSGKTLRGFYFAPNISYNRLSGEHSDVTTSAFSVGGLVGWQWFPGDDFAIGLGLGIDYYTGANSNNGDDFGRYHGTVPAVRFDIGYAW